LIEKFARDQEKLKLDSKLPDSFNPNNPALQELIKDFVAKQPPEKAPTPEQVQRLEQAMRKLTDKQPELPVENASDFPVPAGLTPSGAPAAAPAPDEIKDWLEGFMERAQESQMGDWLRESPAWRRGLEDLQASIANQRDTGNRWGLDGVIDKLRLPERWPQMSDSALARLRDLPTPKLPQWAPSPPRFSPPNFSAPKLSAPRLPDLSAASIGTILTWLLCLILFALLGWQATRWLGKQSAKALGARPLPGAWPVPPDLVTTRAELIQAFDYLAILKLGMQAKPWNHRAVAKGISAQIEAQSQPAEQLADLYEQARYTQGDERLTEWEREQARDALLRLAGMVPA
jgi:hypothetical protein